jgi:hypothetical protein
MRVLEDIVAPLIINFAVIGILAIFTHIYNSFQNLNQTINRNFRVNRTQPIQHRQYKTNIIIIYRQHILRRRNTINRNQHV